MNAVANTTAALCSVFTLIFGGSPLIFSPAPRGDCVNCCAIREPKDIRFLLYTRDNPTTPDHLYVSDEKRLMASHLNTANPLILYLHGFSEQAPGDTGQSSFEVRQAFLEMGDYNVILVDWRSLTALPWYVTSVQNGPRVGRYIARFVRFLIKTGGVDLEKVHVIGFSLGAEVAGFIGKILKTWGLFLPRITGLDPAFPVYMFMGSSDRLSASDARFVDVIHSDGGILGFPWPLGDADFFPNEGVPLQPGCAREEISKNRWVGIFVGCSHQRAWQYFVESIRRPKAFLATKCEKSSQKVKGKPKLESCDRNITAYMGLHADHRLRGRFFLTTNDEPPFGRNFPL
ncbi:phospholipase A1 2 [Phlebotomus argentipes]|uniref:phospholipase A1 2 n=1 Tax=Phlebotomus argentipes TaxID=94469 RepID=UPI002892C5B3|nr:phospholipase A1 2 [Phlebotomus argentipes]